MRKDAKAVKPVAVIGVVNPLDRRVETPEQFPEDQAAASKYIPRCHG